MCILAFCYKNQYLSPKIIKCTESGTKKTISKCSISMQFKILIGLVHWIISFLIEWKQLFYKRFIIGAFVAVICTIFNFPRKTTILNWIKINFQTHFLSKLMIINILQQFLRTSISSLFSNFVVSETHNTLLQIPKLFFWEWCKAHILC